jgi:hypothetical protein
LLVPVHLLLLAARSVPVQLSPPVVQGFFRIKRLLLGHASSTA